MANGNFGGGDGTLANPYLVEDAQDLTAITKNLSGHYKQTVHIDLAGVEWMPIGRNDTSSYSRFSGSFDGNGFNIYGLSINKPTVSYLGLFACLMPPAVLKNIHLVSPAVLGKYEIGPLVGSIEQGGYSGAELPIIDNCSAADVTVNGSYEIGGLVGSAYVEANISNCHSSGVVGNKETPGKNVGGLLGSAYNYGVNFDNSHSSCEAIGRSNVGGFIGYVSPGTGRRVKTTKCYAEGPVYSSGGYCGGFGGYLSQTDFEQCFATGAVDAPSNEVGGFGGYTSDLNIKDCYATGSVNGTDNVGGFIGSANLYNAYTITNSVAFGLVTGTQDTGGFAGSYSGNIDFTSAFYDSDKTGQTGTTKGTPKTTAELAKKETYVGWDFENVWSLISGVLQLIFTLPPKKPEVNVDFTQTVLLRDGFFSPIPQYWDTVKGEWTVRTIPN
ncbi:hypothetical protein D1B33_07425 [Lysinibacillus yapensis]|uniref:GLUG domain-containing protein n=1 Tax=Ureibacillus yapensis TaxID=2304605 RepID=A0A396SIY8_9BACL|nr:GLUG motif-containing protein [Lysinibacillus yapensis]RHW38695.1 hypothetical protein D1B33_07425 [Lysinibacillus yapensis]